MHERFKILRKHFNLTQQEFADRLKIGRSTVANYEYGTSKPSDAAVALICREFSINEEWLRDGTGPMFFEVDIESEFTQWAAETFTNSNDSFKRRFVKMLMKLNEDEWTWLEMKAKEIVGEREYEYNAEYSATKDITSFIDSLPEEPEDFQEMYGIDDAPETKIS